MNNTSSIKSLGTILGMWAHPDDESWLSAGIMREALANGQRVACVTATCGEKGESADEQRWPLRELGRIRKDELLAALSVIGVNEHYFLGCIDGECSNQDENKVLDRLVEIYKTVQPDTILTFGPEGLTGHPDHKAVSHWSDSLVSSTIGHNKNTQILWYRESQEWYEHRGKQIGKQFNIYFMIDKPPTIPEADMDLCFRLNDYQVAKKVQALKLQPSQTDTMFQQLSNNDIRGMVACEGFMVKPIG